MKNKEALTIVKIGGNVIDNPDALNAFLLDFSLLEGYKILVHGGGKTATTIATNLGLHPQMIEGRRITDKPMLDVTVMAYAGLINKDITARLQALQNNAIGFTGADGNLIQSSKRKHATIDYGFVGDIQKVNTPLLELLLYNAVVPVFCAITHNKEAQLLNTNADTVASELAIALSNAFVVSLWYCFEKPGVLTDPEDDTSVIEILDNSLYTALKKTKAIHSGMIPKLDNCFRSLSHGVQKVTIGPHQMIQDKNSVSTSITL